MDQIAIANNNAVRLLQGDDFANFDQAELTLRKAMMTMYGNEFPREQLSATTTSVRVEQEVHPHRRLSVRRCRESSSLRLSSKSASSPTAAIGDCKSSSVTNGMEEEDEEDIYCMSHDGTGIDEQGLMDDEYNDDDDESDTMIAIEPMELTQVNPMQGSGQHMVLPFFNRALLIDSSVALDEEIAAVLLYNFALIHQIKGLYLRIPSIVNKAAKLYELAVSILQRSNRTVSNTNIGEFTVDELLVLALFYNLGHVSAQMMNFDQAGCCFAFLRSILKDDGSDEGESLSLDDEEYSFFFFHAMILQGGEQLPIAPAA